MTFWEFSGGPPVVAFGGNALLPDARDPKAAEANAAAFAEALRLLIPDDAGLVLVHGNGPQVGASLLRVEAARHEVPTQPLDVLVAETQGAIGFQLATALGNAGIDREVVTVVSRVVVLEDDPAMANPSKPVGPFYEEEEGEALARERGWEMVEVPGRGLRRVVPSPNPTEVVELAAIAAAASEGRIVISGGGGGIPVVRSGDLLSGIEGVIDKDRTASLIARSLDARGFLILTEVGHASRSFGGPNEEPLLEMSIADAQALLDAGEFPPGSMGPKIESCISYANGTGRPGVITSVDALPGAMAGKDGTRIVR